MTSIELLTVVVLIVVFSAMIWLMRRKRGRLGVGALGAVEPFMVHSQRQGAQIIIEGRAEERDRETSDDKPKPGPGESRSMQKRTAERGPGKGR
jgi:hypothetical protein